jgi:hypothetical protein
MIPKGTTKVVLQLGSCQVQLCTTYYYLTLILTMTLLGAPVRSRAQASYCFLVPFGIILVQMTLEIYE